ncbi:MAG: A/G-specific adenine glycosylase, partial [Candidatus Limnocylindrales bacterium]
ARTAFTARLPTVEALARASPADVLRAWQGLGYNRRAINLQRTARIIVDELGGVFPRTVAGLERLPGIGPYTARAVASIAFRQPTGAVDTNVRRVLGRVLVGDPRRLSARELQAAADRLVDPERPDRWTQALMDIGSSLCRPARPACPECPVQAACRYAAGDRPGPAGAGTPRRTKGAASPANLPFEATTRWLRGRILDRLRETPGDAWTVLPDSIGQHAPSAVRTSLLALRRDGLLELDEDADGRQWARLPIA